MMQLFKKKHFKGVIWYIGPRTIFIIAIGKTSTQ